MDEATIWAKLRKIEALHAGTSSDGERQRPREQGPPGGEDGGGLGVPP